MKRYSRRETEVLEALYRMGEGAVGDIREAIDAPPSYDAVRTTLRILESKGAVRHRIDGRRFVYAPVLPEKRAWQSTARRLADVFFGGSMQEAAVAMLKLSDPELSEGELQALERRLGATKDKS